MIEYRCNDCDVSEFEFIVICCKECPNCSYLMEAIEGED